MTTNGSTAVSGSNGFAVVGASSTKLPRLTSWSLNFASSESAWGDSDSAGYTNRIKARLDGTGTIAGKFDTGTKVYTIFKPGDIVKLVLWEDGEDATPADYWQFPCVLIQSFELEFDQDGKTVVGWSANFGADGIFYEPGNPSAPSETFPAS